jgi:nitroreductase
MNVKKAIETRRAYRSIEPVKITKELIEDLATLCTNYSILL